MESATGEAFVTVMTAPAGNFGRQSLPGNMESASAVNEVLRVIGRNPRALRITSSGTTSSASSRPVIRGGPMVRNSVIPYGRTAILATTLHLRVGPERLTHNAPPPRRPRSPTLQGERKAAPEPAHRHFGAVPTNMLWSADVTEIETGGRRPYLATTFDLLSRCLLGSGTAPQRRPGQCLAHEGRGSQGRARGRLDPPLGSRQRRQLRGLDRRAHRVGARRRRGRSFPSRSRSSTCTGTTSPPDTKAGLLQHQPPDAAQPGAYHQWRSN